MTSPPPLSEHAAAVYDVLVATARRDDAGRLVSTEPLYRFLLDRFGIDDPASRDVRTKAVRELTERGLVRRTTTRGRSVEVLLEQDADTRAGRSAADDDLAADYSDYAAAVEGDLDRLAERRVRVEQSFLRRVLLGGRGAAPCTFCGLALPADLLVAAHLKRRAELTQQEKLQFREVAVLACTLGCDALYEHGYVAVDGHGRLLAASAGCAGLDTHLAGLRGRSVGPFGPISAAYLEEHRLQRFLGR